MGHLSAVGSLTLLLFLAAVPVIAATMPAVKMKVVDGPLEGTITGHGGNHAILFALGFGRGCTWKRVPRALVAADRMFPNPGKTNTLRTLFMNDALFVRQGCGSPKAFFEPYLRP